VNCKELKELELVIMNEICREDVRSRGKGCDRSFNMEELLNRIFSGTPPYTSHHEAIDNLERYHLVERNGQNIQLTKDGQNWCTKCNLGYEGSYPPSID
jgi:hypothetical protein